MIVPETSTRSLRTGSRSFSTTGIPFGRPDRRNLQRFWWTKMRRGRRQYVLTTILAGGGLLCRPGLNGPVMGEHGVGCRRTAWWSGARETHSDPAMRRPCEPIFCECVCDACGLVHAALRRTLAHLRGGDVMMHMAAWRASCRLCAVRMFSTCGTSSGTSVCV